MTRLTQVGRIDYNRKCEQWPLQWSAEKGKNFTTLLSGKNVEMSF